MKLFYQLGMDEQEEAIHHCSEIVLQNALEHGLAVEVSTEEEGGAELKERIESLIERAKSDDFETDEDRIDFLMSDQFFSEAVYEMAAEMATNAFYHDEDELVIFTSELSRESPEDLNAPVEETLKTEAPSEMFSFTKKKSYVN